MIVDNIPENVSTHWTGTRQAEASHIALCLSKGTEAKQPADRNPAKPHGGKDHIHG
jgi:hypothetical protein